MAVEQSYLPNEPYLPQNTVVVLPKPLPMNRGAFWVLFWTIGLLMGLFVRTIIDGANDPILTNGAGANSASAGDLAAIGEAPTMEVHVRAVLEMPTPTATSSPHPTATASPDPASSLDFCANNDPGKLCRVPFPPPPRPTPYPSCTDMKQLNPGDWCVWPTQPPGFASH
ncbi:MAG TPA: hypothetical protein VKB09_15445 [Thermomicrobiales bacterium]|nr:hypothetical protein [Thermomicrobiales bacterium]